MNKEFNKPVASALDNSRVDINVADASSQSVTMLISRVQNLVLNVHTPAKIVINERTGTIVMGGDVKLSPVSVIHGNLSIQVVTNVRLVHAVGGLGQPGELDGGAAGQAARGGRDGLETLQPIVVPETQPDCERRSHPVDAPGRGSECGRVGQRTSRHRHHGPRCGCHSSGHPGRGRNAG